jgi:arylformamidase
MTENPGLSERAARYLASKKVNAVAIDGPSIDTGANSSFTVYKIWLPRNIVIVENLCNLRKISTDRFMLAIGPLKLRGVRGSPARVLALL